MTYSDSPTWTVLSNTVNPKSKWIGTLWEFFSDEESAQTRYNELEKQEDLYVPTMRPFHEGCDRPHMGACHHYFTNERIENEQ